MKLLIDQGNSRLKYCFWDGVKYSTPGIADTAYLFESLEDQLPVESVWVSSVRDLQQQQQLKDVLGALNTEVHFAETQAETAGLINSYSKPQSMGIDRWLAMLAIWRDIQDEFVLIDAGTALTFDYVDSDGSHQGGHIIPGLELMRDALTSRTGKIIVSGDFTPNRTLANNTSDAVLHGCMTTLTAYLEVMLTSLPSSVKDAIYITGGDAVLLQESLHFDSYLRQDLVFKGLVEYFTTQS
jgi:type III pantothenate kinase